MQLKSTFIWKTMWILDITPALKNQSKLKIGIMHRKFLKSKSIYFQNKFKLYRNKSIQTCQLIPIHKSKGLFI